jgi:putative phosphoribosyl transferase
MFANRAEAGKALAEAVARLRPENPVVLALPRGGVPVAAEVAKAIQAPLGLLLVRKLGAPGHEELAAGAVGEGDPPLTVFNRDVLKGLGLTEADFAPVIARKAEEIAERRRLYLGGRADPEIEGKTAILVDDGIATGATAKAALDLLAARCPKRTILAVPVASAETVSELREKVGDLVCLEAPALFFAVGAHYRDFRQVSDAEVARLLRQAQSPS